MYPPPDVSRRQSVLSPHHLVPGEECPRNLDNASVKVLLSPRNYNDIKLHLDSNCAPGIVTSNTFENE